LWRAGWGLDDYAQPFAKSHFRKLPYNSFSWAQDPIPVRGGDHLGCLDSLRMFQIAHIVNLGLF